MKKYITTGAVLSSCKTYRYRLWRYWKPDESPLCFIMLNPSTADAEDDDPTIRKCVGFAERYGYGGIEVVNLFAYRATNPQHLLSFPNREGPENDATILWVAKSTIANHGRVVAAWGAHPAALRDERAAKVLDTLFANCVWPYALGFSKEGHPNHPLMLSYDREMVEVPL